MTKKFKRFCIDFFAAVPFDRIFRAFGAGGNQLRALKIIRVLRLGRLMKLIRLFKIEGLKDAIENVISNTALSMIQLIAKIVFVCHLLACAWYWVGSFYNGQYRCPDQVNDPWCRWDLIDEDGI